MSGDKKPDASLLETAVKMDQAFRREGVHRCHASDDHQVRILFERPEDILLKGKGYFLFEADIKDDMLYIRKRRDSLFAAVRWSKYLRRYLVPEQPDDSLLVNLYWCMKLLTVPVIPADAVTWRLLRLWLEEWGLAPELVPFHTEKGFNQEEIALLAQVPALTYKGIINLFTGRLSPSIRENIFKVASELALEFFNET